jgi:hypothetical protein
MVPFNPDIIAGFDYFRLDSLTIPSDLYSLNLSDTALVSNELLLSHFGYDTEPYCPSNFRLFYEISNQYLHVQAAQILEAQNKITNQAQVVFGAGTEISLLPGFDLGINSTLQIALTGCQE